MSHLLRVSIRRALQPLALLAAISGAAAASAEANPYYIGASQAFSYDSNVFRTPNRLSDYTSSTGLLAGIDQPFGRQRFYADGSVQANRHDRLKQLNNTSYSLTTGLDWETVEHLSGTVRYFTHQSLADYGSVDAPVSFEKDLEKTQDLSATVRYGITPRVGLDGSVEHRSVDFSAPQDLRTYKQDVASLGMHWGSSGLLILGAAARHTRSDYPQVVISAPQAGPPPVPGVIAADQGDRNDLDLTATWTPSGLSTVNARVSLTHESHTQPSRPNFSGVTGAVTWNYKPTGKLNFVASLTRDTGAETSFSAVAVPGAPLLRVDSNSLNNLASLDATYAITSKILLSAAAHYYSGTVSNGVSSVDAGATKQYTFDARYTFTRSVTFDCNVGHESRSGLYSDNTASCSAQVVFR